MSREIVTEAEQLLRLHLSSDSRHWETRAGHVIQGLLAELQRVEQERHVYGDLLYAKGELESIKALLSDRSEPGTYAKVAALADEHEAAESSLASLRAALEEQIREWRTDADELDAATHGQWVEPGVRRACADDLEERIAALSPSPSGAQQ